MRSPCRDHMLNIKEKKEMTHESLSSTYVALCSQYKIFPDVVINLIFA